MRREREMTEHERRVYRKKMKGIRDALRAGDKERANRLAAELQDFFGVN